MGGLRAGGQPAPDSTISRYQSNAYALSQGQRLYQAMNCVGCHFHGGGGIGPPLMDSEWIYGSDPSQIFNTIVEGRPNGMPSFKDKLTNQQVWQLTAYVRALSGLSSTSGTSSREDDMYLSPNLAIREREKPKGETIPRP
jgi:cytochrome c oxidase cbb3-type subunit 3